MFSNNDLQLIKPRDPLEWAIIIFITKTLVFFSAKNQTAESHKLFLIC